MDSRPSLSSIHPPSSILNSNHSTPHDTTHRRLKAMGFEPDVYVDCITSGEMVFEGLRDRRAAPYSEIKGTRCVGRTKWMGMNRA